ncbi:MAG: glycosyltransferase [Planctomycetota bacterium]|jgi:glycosyltransferase involved in cell wall biosynthesis
MKLIAEISQGAGNCIQATPMLSALWLLGHETDIFINSKLAKKLKPLWDGWECIGNVYTDIDQFSATAYDFGVSAFGRRSLVRLFPPGMVLKVEKRHVLKQSETEANCEIARWLGYAGPTPPQFVQSSDRIFELPDKYITIHAGCDPAAMKYKNWPHWADFASKLQDDGWKVFAIGTDHDRSAENWEQEFGAEISFNLSFQDLAAFMKGATFHFGNDSGYGHLAAALNIPGMVLFGPTDPLKNGPHNPTMKKLIAKINEGEERSISAEKPVPITRLGLEQVWDAAQKVLRDSSVHTWPELPARIEDCPSTRWENYVRMTQQQTEPEGLEIKGVQGKPKVSVVIPSFNRRENLQRAIKSVQQQNVEWEILVCDDGSTDGTAEDFTEPADGIVYIGKPNAGASSARNVGLRRAKGEWIALLDSDDEWHDGKLEKQLKACGTDYVAAASRHVHVNRDGSKQNKPDVVPGHDQHLFSDLFENLSLKTSSLIFKTHLLDKIGLFNERFPISNDWDFFLRLAKAVNNSGFTCIPDALLTVHRSKDSISKTGRTNALEEAFTRICMVNALSHNGDAFKKEAVRRAARKHLELSRAYRKQGDKKAALRHARSAVRGGSLAGAYRWLQALLASNRAV